VTNAEPKGLIRTGRVLVIGLVVVLIVLGLILIVRTVLHSMTPADAAPVDALASSRDACVACHRETTPGIVEQYGRSTMAAAEVRCLDCHGVASDYADAVAHEGSSILGSPTPAMCAKCHSAEVTQFNQSRHSLPAYVAYAGSKDLTPEMQQAFAAVAEGAFAPDKSRNALYDIEGPEITGFACETCHDVGKPQSDGSIGRCQSCHLRHEFSLGQARKAETCNYCHIGPDHPQYEIYWESPHGIAYATGGEDWDWEAEPGTLTAADFPAATCAICHMSGFGASSTTHDVGDRLTWFLAAPISERRPSWQDNKLRMQNVCRECHNQEWIDDFYAAADAGTNKVNGFVQQGDAIVAPLKEQGLMTDAPFDEPIDFTYFEMWHHWGRTAKFGMWMQGPDYTQWHGIYELVSDLSELQQLAKEKILDAVLEGIITPAATPGAATP
jgi:hydroxylamine dehydrogenase